MSEVVITQNDRLLKSLIAGSLICQKSVDYINTMADLTSFVDGFIARTKDAVLFQNHNETTSLDIEYFRFDEMENPLEKALIYCCGVGAENSVVLVQQNEVEDGLTKFEDLPERLQPKEILPEGDPVGYMVVSLPDPNLSLDNAFMKMDKPNIQEVLDMQAERYHKLHAFGEQWYDYRFAANEAISQKRWKDRQRMYPAKPYRDNVVYTSGTE